ncbi:MAG: glycogen/starch synthase [Vampirovibrio sp.]|nr:glycogen/starch synthase [Vampirovibrio sp.]
MQLSSTQKNNLYINRYLSFKANSEKSQTIQIGFKRTNINPIFFGSSNRNSDQVLMTAYYCDPYLIGNGTANAVSSLSKALKKAGKDVRLFIPCLDSHSITVDSGALYWKPTPNKKYELENTNIETSFNTGLFKTDAHLYRLKYPVGNVPVYLVNSPIMDQSQKGNSNNPQRSFKNFMARVAFNQAVAQLEKKVSESRGSNFKPLIMHGNDWAFNFTRAEIDNIKRQYPKAYDKLATVFTIHPSFPKVAPLYGVIPPLFLALSNFNPQELKRLQNNQLFMETCQRVMTKTTQTQQEKKEKDLLKKLALHLDDLMNNKEAAPLLSKLNEQIVAMFPEKQWDVNQETGTPFYNPTIDTIIGVNRYIIVSPTFRSQLIHLTQASTPVLQKIKNSTQTKAHGIANGIDPHLYNAGATNLYKPYTVNTIQQGKQANKTFLLEQFSKGNIENKTVDSRLLPGNFPKIAGYLNKPTEQNALLLLASRFDYAVKGIDIGMKTVKALLDTNKNFQVIMALKGSTQSKNQEIKAFIHDVVENPKYEGRIVLLDAFVPMQQYLAGTDIYFMPSRYEGCALTPMQAMRYGTIPVIGRAGGSEDVVINYAEQPNKATAFVSACQLKDIEVDPNADQGVKQMQTILSLALKLYDENPEQWQKLQKNAMNLNNSWDKAATEYLKVYRKTIKDTQKIQQELLKLNQIV